MTSKILIVDDHPMVRLGLRQLIENEPDLSVCGEASGSGEALDLVSKTSPDLILVDITLNDGHGIELIKQVHAQHEHIKMLVMSMHDETLFAERALQAGAMGYINKEEANDKALEAIRQILKGKIYLSERMSEHMLMRMANKDKPQELSPIETLSNRELEVFEQIGLGLSTRKIAERFHLSVKTIETHRENIKRKLNLQTANELTRSAFQWVLEKDSDVLNKPASK